MNLHMLHVVVRGAGRTSGAPELADSFARLSASEQRAVRAWRRGAQPNGQLRSGLLDLVLEWMALPTAQRTQTLV
jgi:hypothetical protein